MVSSWCLAAGSSSAGIPKKRGTVHFRRAPDGHVSLVIVNQNGKVEAQKDFGVFAEAQYEKLFDVIRQEHPKMEIHTVELTGN
jgi:hypothetical protein